MPDLELTMQTMLNMYHDEPGGTGSRKHASVDVFEGLNAAAETFNQYQVDMNTFLNGRPLSSR